MSLPGATAAPTDGAVASTPLRTAAGLLLIATAGSGVLNYAYTLALTHLLAPHAYSRFASSQALLLITGTMANAAVPWVLAQELRRAHSEAERRAAISTGLTLNIVLGVAAAGGCAILASGFLAAPVLAMLVASALGFFVASTGMGWAQGQGRYRVLAAMVAGEVGIKAVAGVALVELGGGVTGAVAGAAIGSVAVIVGAVIGLGRGWRPTWSVPHMARMWRTTAGMSLLQGLLIGTAIVDVVLVVVIFPTGSRVAAYQLAATLGRAPVFLAIAVAMVAYPAIVGSRSSRAADGELAADGLRLLLTLVLPAWAILSTVPRGLVLLVAPPSYAQALHFLPVTAGSGAVWAVVTFLCCCLRAAGRSRLAVSLLAVCAVVGVVAVTTIGRTGGLWAVAIIELLTAAAACVGVGCSAARWWGRPRGRGLAPSLLWLVAVAPLAAARTQPVVWVVLAVATGLACLGVAFPAWRKRLGSR